LEHIISKRKTISSKDVAQALIAKRKLAFLDYVIADDTTSALIKARNEILLRVNAGMEHLQPALAAKETEMECARTVPREPCNCRLLFSKQTSEFFSPGLKNTTITLECWPYDSALTPSFVKAYSVEAASRHTALFQNTYW
jgi:hypothetical protein